MCPESVRRFAEPVQFVRSVREIKITSLGGGGNSVARCCKRFDRCHDVYNRLCDQTRNSCTADMFDRSGKPWRQDPLQNIALDFKHLRPERIVLRKSYRCLCLACSMISLHKIMDSISRPCETSPFFMSHLSSFISFIYHLFRKFFRNR